MSESLKAKAERHVFSDPTIRESMKCGCEGLSVSFKRMHTTAEFVFSECFGDFANKQFGAVSNEIMKDVLEIVIPLGLEVSAWPTGTYEAVFAKICGPLKTAAAAWYMSGVFAGAVGVSSKRADETK